MKIRELLQDGERLLAQAKKPLSPESFDSPAIDCKAILAFVLNVDNLYFFKYPNKELDSQICDTFFKLLDERIKGKPIAYITNEREFYGYSFYVNENCLIPRPDTEIIIEQALNLIDTHNLKTVLDLCTGSGCIAATIKKERPDVLVTAIDISDKALEVAKYNFKNLNTNIEVIESDLFTNLDKSFDLIVTNPPYIPEDEFINLKPQLFEPELALVAENSGLALIIKIIEESKNHLHNDGHILIESTSKQTYDIEKLLFLNSYKNVKIIKDLANKERVTYGNIIK